MPDVFAAGDVTDFPIKQGGIAAQQADAAAQTIAALAGAPIEPEPFRPVLRGCCSPARSRATWRRRSTAATARPPRPPRSLCGGRRRSSSGRHLAPFLAAHAGLAIPSEPPSAPDAIPVDVDLEASRTAA